MISVEYVSPDGVVKDAFEMADGMTLDQAARTICPDTEGKFPVPTIAIVGSKPAVRELGDWNFPLSDGARIQFRQLAMGGGGGGGSNPLQLVMQIAIVALAVAASGALGLEFSGVDIMESAHGLLVCEVNGNAGFRSVSSLGTADIPAELFAYLASIVGR